MPLTPFHAMYIARELSNHSNASDKLLAAYVSSRIEVYPYQVAAAAFALRSPYINGVILVDEGSLGKTYEAMLVISQMWFEGRERLLIIVPTPLLGQWNNIMADCFSVPYMTIDSNEIYSEIKTDNPFLQPEVILTTYEFALRKAEDIKAVVWDAVVFDEAHRLSSIESKTTTTLKEAIGDAYRLLLTATPMQNSIMDLFALVHFIDDMILGDSDEFYKRYFRKPENYHELTSRVSRYCFRTLRSQVERYVGITRRLPVTANYNRTSAENRLAGMLDSYLSKPNKTAFPQMDKWELSLMMWRTFASSTAAFNKMLEGITAREPEAELVEMLKLSENIKINVKGQELLKVLKKAFVELKKHGSQQKTLIFTESLTTQQYLLNLLTENGYRVLTHNGEKSRDYDIMSKFERESDILIATDTAAEGFNLSFCSCIVNYDLPYNVLTLEQRVMRCHRQGQQSDVVVLNFLSRDNLADTRMLELINKRVLQFDGIMGMSDDIAGSFSDYAVDGITQAFKAARTKDAIAAEFKSRLKANEDTNVSAVEEAENILFTTFTQDIAKKVTINPQYVKDKTEEINRKLWELTKWFFNGKRGYECIDETRSVKISIQPEKVFTGAHLGRREYSIDDKTLPKSGWHTLCGSLAKNIMKEIFWTGIPDTGRVRVSGSQEQCGIGYYQVKIKPKDGYFGIADYDVFVGKSMRKGMLSDKECCKIMNMPVIEYTAEREKYGDRDGLNKPKHKHELDDAIDTDEFIRRAVSDTDEVRKEEISGIQERTYQWKQSLNRDISVLRNQLLQIENALSHTSAVTERIDAEKKKASASRELKQREQSLFLDSIRLETEAEQTIKTLTEQSNLTAEVKRMFAISILPED